jgi:hypothetical protein
LAFGIVASVSSPASAIAVIVAAESGFVDVQAMSTVEPRGICTIRDAATCR